MEIGSTYTLKIINVNVDRASDPVQLTVEYEGQNGKASMTGTLESTDINGLMLGCKALAQHIFHAEFRMNGAVEIKFSLADENGLALWHISPSFYLKYPLTMSMKWSCLHLSDIFKTMTTLGIVQLPPSLPLEGNQLDINKTAKVIMDAMGNGVEFMGNVMLMRSTIDHASAKLDGLQPPARLAYLVQSEHMYDESAAVKHAPLIGSALS